jgi:hypothetical protein
LTLIAISNAVGWMTASSAGFSPLRIRPANAQVYVKHRPVTRARAGSATGLNIGSQPGGTYAGKGNVSLKFMPAGLTGSAGFIGRRSPLSARLTLIEGPDPAAFGAVAAQTTEATVQLRNTAATKCFRLQPKISHMTNPLGLFRD